MVRRLMITRAKSSKTENLLVTHIYNLLPNTKRTIVTISIMAKTRVYIVEVILRKIDFLVSLIPYMEFKPFIIARKPFPADHRAVITVTEIKVLEPEESYICVIILTIKDLNALGKTWVKVLSTVLSSKLK